MNLSMKYTIAAKRTLRNLMSTRLVLRMEPVFVIYLWSDEIRLAVFIAAWIAVINVFTEVEYQETLELRRIVRTSLISILFISLGLLLLAVVNVHGWRGSNGAFLWSRVRNVCLIMEAEVSFLLLGRAIALVMDQKT